MIQAKEELLAALAAAVVQIAPDTGLAPVLEVPKQAEHGDLAIVAAMQIAKATKANPRGVAVALVAAMNEQPAVGRWVDAIEVVGPGFINLRLKDKAKQAVVAEVLQAGDRFGQRPAHGRKLMVEFVSANPTGPLHVGHGRQGALGDTLCRLHESQGWDVTRESYYNDAGAQIATLAASTQARIQGLAPGDEGWPGDAYNGDYIADIAVDFMAKKTAQADGVSFTASGDPDDLEGIRRFAVASLRHEQDLDLTAFGVTFQNHFLESSLYASGQVDAAVAKMIASGKTYEADGALWLKSTDFGDDKDRVMRKSAAEAAAKVAVGSDAGSSYTYFVPDVAYHIDKWGRGFDRVINVQGSDHHGTIARVRAGLQAADVGIPQGWPEYVLHKMVTVLKDGAEVKVSKRAGGYVTLRDLIDWTSRDAVRFFLVSRTAGTEFVFDVDAAVKADNTNPVFYVQYAHARLCSVLTTYAEKLGAIGDSGSATVDLSLLTAPTEAALMLKLGAYPDVLTAAAADMAPHEIAFYLRDVAKAFHSYYGAEVFLVEDPVLEAARMALLAATRQVLRNALDVLGVSAPKKM